MVTSGNQNSLRLAFGVSRTAPKDAPQQVLRAVDSEAMALAISIKAGNHKLACIAARIGKSESYVCRMASGERAIPHKLVDPLCVATGSNLLKQFIRLQKALNGDDPIALLVEQMRAAA